MVAMSGVVLSVLVGCGEEEATVKKITDDEVMEYVDISKNIGDVVYSNASFTTIRNAFKRQEDVIDSSLFSKKFDVSKLEVKNMYDTEETITDKELSDVVVERDDESGTVRVMTVYRVGMEIDHADNVMNADSDAHDTNHSHPKDIYSRVFTDAYTFKNGKMIEFKSYR